MIIKIESSVFINNIPRLTSTEAKRVWESIDLFYTNRHHNSLNLEKLVNTQNSNLWSIRASQKRLRLIIHENQDIWTIIYIGRQHDDAYDFANKLNSDFTPSENCLILTTENQELDNSSRSKIEKIAYPIYDYDWYQQAEKLAILFDEDRYADEYLLSLGITQEWLPTIRQIKSEDDIWNAIENESFSDDIADLLLNLIDGKIPTPSSPPLKESTHNNQKNKVQENNQQKEVGLVCIDPNINLQKMLNAPLATWLTFLHPDQYKYATGTFKNALKITGSAGTGKTILALHRAKYLAQQGKKVLLTTFVNTLCLQIEKNLKYLCTSQELENITVSTVHKQAKKIVRESGDKIIVPENIDFKMKTLIKNFYFDDCPLDQIALFSEWRDIIQAQNITNLEEYKKADRKGTGKPLNEKQRTLVWQVFKKIFNDFNKHNLTDWQGLCCRARKMIESAEYQSPFNAVIVDELQDLKPQEILLLKALAGEGENSLTLLGDGGQRIYAGNLNLLKLGIETRGSSPPPLSINYRNTREIINFAELIIGDQNNDLEGGIEKRQKIFNSFNGKKPIIKGFETAEQQLDFIIEQINNILDEESINLDEIAIFARTKELLHQVEITLKKADIPYYYLDDPNENVSLGINLGTMHRAKGLEFKAVFVISVSDDFIPLPFLIEQATDENEKENIINLERQLLYVSVTRARDELFVSWVGQPSLFLKDIML